MVLVVLGLLLVPLPIDEKPQVEVRAETRAPEQLGMVHPLLRSASRVLDGSQPSQRVLFTWRRSSTPSSTFQPRSNGRHVAGAIIGAVAGFFAGGYLGANLEPNCACDDPGLKGFLIGAPIGAVAGGILGGKYSDVDGTTLSPTTPNFQL